MSMATTCLCIPLFGGRTESAEAGQLTLQETVAGTDMPWNFTPGGLNTNFQYGINDGTGPLVPNASDGFSFAPGGSFTVTYISGLVSAGPGFWPFVDADGDTQEATDNHTGTGEHHTSGHGSHRDRLLHKAPPFVLIARTVARTGRPRTAGK
jgi:hypothetical protein